MIVSKPNEGVYRPRSRSRMEGIDKEELVLKQRRHRENHHHPDHYQHGHQDRKDVDLS